MTVSPNTSKLPRWAADYIDQLEKNVEYWKTRATEGPEQSDTFLTTHGDADKPLGKGYTIHFVTGPGHGDYVDVRNEGDGTVEIRTAWLPMHITPKSNNTITVRPDTRE